MATPAQHGSSTGNTSCLGAVGPVLVSGHCPPSYFVSKADAGEGGLVSDVWDRAGQSQVLGLGKFGVRS